MGCTHSNERTVANSSQRQLSEGQIEELVKTRFNRLEILDWYSVFIDKCGASGDASLLTACINKTLFIDYFNQLHPHGDVTRLIETFFRTYDLNDDGAIDFMEFIKAVSIIRRGDLTEKLSFIFSLLDFDQKGYIDRLKLVQMMEALYNVKGMKYNDDYNILLRKVDRLITRLDRDKEDGRICRSKFIESCMNDPALRDSLNGHQ